MEKNAPAVLLDKPENSLGDSTPETLEAALLIYGDNDIAQFIHHGGERAAELRLRLDIYDPMLAKCHVVLTANQGAIEIARIEGENIRNACRQLTNDVVEKIIRQAIKVAIAKGKSGDVRLINGRLYPENLPFPPRLSFKERNNLFARAKRASNLYCIASIALLAVVGGVIFGQINMVILLVTPCFLGTMAALDRRMKLDVLIGISLGSYQSHYERANRQRRSFRNAINTARGA